MNKNVVKFIFLLYNVPMQLFQFFILLKEEKNEKETVGSSYGRRNDPGYGCTGYGR